MSVHEKILHGDKEKAKNCYLALLLVFHFSAIIFHVDSCESYATLDTDERQKSGFISDIKRKSLTNPPTEKSRFKLVRLGWGTGILNPALALRGRQAAPTKRKRVPRLQLAPISSAPYLIQTKGLSH